MRIFILFMLLFASAMPAMAQPTVVASIRPLQLIAMAVTDGVSEPMLVLDSSQDPHHPALKPSQRRLMDQADLFVWVGPELETGLERVVAELDATVIGALASTDMRVRQISAQPDPHLWLDTYNAGHLAELIARELGKLDGDNADIYQANLSRFRAALETLDTEIRRELAAEDFPPFAVYHDGYQYFENRYGLAHRASFVGNDEVQPGIRQLLAIKQALEENDVNCIVAGPSVNTGYLDNLLGRDKMIYARVDVLAHDAPLAADGYAAFMRRLASSFASCRL